MDSVLKKRINHVILQHPLFMMERDWKWGS